MVVQARFASGHASAGDVNGATSVDDAISLSRVGIHAPSSAKAASTYESSPESSISSRTTDSSRWSTPKDYPATHVRGHGRRATHWSMVHALEASLKRRATVQTSPRGTLAQIGGAEKEHGYRGLPGGAGVVEFSFLDDD